MELQLKRDRLQEVKEGIKVGDLLKKSYMKIDS